MNGLLAQFLKRHQYLFTKKLTDQVLLRISTSGVQMPSPFALGVESAQKAAFDVLPDLPEVKVHAVHDGAVAVRVGIANLLRFMLSVPGLRELLQESGFQGIAVKVCADAADLVNSRNVTALSIMIILPRLGNNPRHPALHRLLSEGDDVRPSLGGQTGRAGPGFPVPEKPEQTMGLIVSLVNSL